jgi:hypothetical protein
MTWQISRKLFDWLESQASLMAQQRNPLEEELSFLLVQLEEELHVKPAVQ